MYLKLNLLLLDKGIFDKFIWYNVPAKIEALSIKHIKLQKILQLT